MTAIESAEERKRLRIAIEELQKENESEVQGLKDDKEFLTDRVRQLSNAEAEVKRLGKFRGWPFLEAQNTRLLIRAEEAEADKAKLVEAL